MVEYLISGIVTNLFCWWQSILNDSPLPFLFFPSGFQGLYDVEHFVNSLKGDVRIVGSIPEIQKNGKSKKLKAFQVMFNF